MSSGSVEAIHISAGTGEPLQALDSVKATSRVGLEVVPGASGPFLLLHAQNGERLREGLRELGIAVRRGETFPGLGPDWLRLSVRDRRTNERVLAALSALNVRSPP